MSENKETVLSEVKNFWAEIMRDQGVSVQHRLKASELYLKLEGEEKEEGLGVVIISGENELED